MCHSKRQRVTFVFCEKETESVPLLPGTLWFETAFERIEESNRLDVPTLNGRPKALSDRKLNLADDETFVFSLELIEKLKEEFKSGHGGETEQGWLNGSTCIASDVVRRPADSHTLILSNR